MRKKNKDSVPHSRKKNEPDEKNMDDEVETTKFINRLAIQRKLLNNFVDLTIIQVPENNQKESKLFKIKQTNKN